MARKTGTSIKMHDHKSTEKTGSCKCLVKQGLDVSLCGDNTLKSEFHYCRDCYSFIRSLYGMKSTKEWPPMRKNHESRYCFDIDEHKTFLINKQWMKKYDAELMSDSAIGFKHPKYRKGGNYPCYVYVFKCKDGMHYIGQTRNLIKNRIKKHKTKPSETVKKHGGFQALIRGVKVDNRNTALSLEGLLVQLLNDLGIPATKGD